LELIAYEAHPESLKLLTNISIQFKENPLAQINPPPSKGDGTAPAYLCLSHLDQMDSEKKRAAQKKPLFLQKG